METETFAHGPETRWRFVADSVMGGVSTGQLAFQQEAGQSHARLTGRVSTANNGGFIQMRMAVTEPLPDGITGVRLVVRGNDQRYFVHLRTTAAIRPTHYYQAGFEAAERWQEVRLPFSAFTASTPLLAPVPVAASLTAIGIVAFGRDHDADIAIRELGFF